MSCVGQMISICPRIAIKRSLIASVPLRRRSASTINSGVNSHSEWPKKSHPSPYEVLNISLSHFDKKKLKDQYFKLVKIYHPDISATKQVKDHNGGTLTEVQKNERFKLVTEAYNLLKDHRKKSAYDQYKIGWGAASRHLNDDAFASQKREHASQAYYGTHEYWSAGNWEDYQNLHKNQASGGMAHQDTMKVLAMIVCFMIAGVTVQGWYIFDNVEKTVLEHKKIHDGCEEDLTLAYTNFGLDVSKISRIRRFLWFRTFGLYYEKEHLDQSSKENETLMREVIGDCD